MDKDKNTNWPGYDKRMQEGEEMSKLADKELELVSGGNYMTAEQEEYVYQSSMLILPQLEHRTIQVNAPCKYCHRLGNVYAAASDVTPTSTEYCRCKCYHYMCSSEWQETRIDSAGAVTYSTR